MEGVSGGEGRWGRLVKRHGRGRMAEAYKTVEIPFQLFLIAMMFQLEGNISESVSFNKSWVRNIKKGKSL